MLEVFSEAIRPINLPFTVLLSVLVLYWSLVALGALGLDFGAHTDIDGHVDTDLHVDSDVHVDHDLDTGDAHSDWSSHLLGFINIGEVPITIVLSIMTLCMWVLSIIVNYYWTGGLLLLGVAALIPIVLISAVVTRYLTMPFKPLMRALNREGDEHLPIVGRTCQISTSEANAQFGQAKIDTKGAPIVINIRMLEGGPLPRGATALVVRQDRSKDIFYVVPVSSDRLE
ncbi:hypothetical protein ACXR0O_22385 [Verrucomicrobiota bacterium sgz303538]